MDLGESSLDRPEVSRRDVSYVLAGVDGSTAGERALRWAADEARSRRLPLTVCHVWHWSNPVPPSGPEALESARRIGRHVLDKAVLLAREMVPQTEVRGRLAAAPEHAVLVNESEEACLAFIGGRPEAGHVEETGAAGYGGFGPGASPVRLPAYSRCPIIVVRSAADRRRPIVVGVDGTPGSEAALAFGFEEAALRGLPLLAVCGAWEPEAVTCAEMGMLTDPEHLRETAAIVLDRTVSPWLEKYPYVAARTRTLMLTPKHALLKASEGAGLLVLGGREFGGVAGLRLGTVTTAMLQDAPCSVAVVRPRT